MAGLKAFNDAMAYNQGLNLAKQLVPEMLLLKWIVSVSSFLGSSPVISLIAMRLVFFGSSSLIGALRLQKSLAGRRREVG
jgi:hypothetical protein